MFEHSNNFDGHLQPFNTANITGVLFNNNFSPLANVVFIRVNNISKLFLVR